MRKHERKRLMAEVAELLGSNTIPMCESTMENAVTHYTEVQYTQRELDAVFTKSPRVLGASALVPEIGDFFTDDISGEPLLITRDTDSSGYCHKSGAKIVW
jgi:hypothetical protein